MTSHVITTEGTAFLASAGTSRLYGPSKIEAEGAYIVTARQRIMERLFLLWAASAHKKTNPFVYAPFE